MTEQLKQAAQQALDTLKELQGGCTDSDDGTVEAITVWCPEVIEALERALTTSQPAQVDERGAFEARVAGKWPWGYGDAAWEAWQARASLPTQPAAQEHLLYEDGSPGPVAQPAARATPEPVQADSSEHLRVIASLGAALRRLSFAAQTSGGTAGPDAELQAAIGQAEQALSFGGIAQAMFATPAQQAAGEPVGEVAEYQARLVSDGHATPWERADKDLYERTLGQAGWEHRKLYTHPAPGVPEGWREVIEKMVKGIDHLAELARQWEPDYSSGADRKGWVLAKNARDEAVDMLAAAQAKGGAA